MTKLSAISVQSHGWRMVLQTLAALGLTIAVSYAAMADDQSIVFPASAADLAGGSHWNMSGDHGGSNACDMNVARFGDGQTWVDTASGGGSANADRLVFGIPLYAPADGEVVSCWRNHPDNPEPGTPRPERCCGDDCELSCDDSACPSSVVCKIARSGNHVVIRKRNGDVVLLAHLESKSVPENVCPHNAQFMQNARNRKGDFPEESFVEAGARPAVRQGQFIGRGGNSGASSGPHLHLHTASVSEQPDGSLNSVGETTPTLVSYAWIRDRAPNAPWRKLSADAISNPPVLVHSSPFLRRDTAAGGTFSEVAMDGSVVAFRNSEGNLQIIPYLVNAQGGLTRGEVVKAGKASKVRLVHPDPGSANAVTALRDQDGKLKVIAWQVAQSGQVTRKGDALAGPVEDIALTPFPNGKGTITLTRGNQNDFKLIAWELTPALNVVRKGDVGAGTIKHMDVTTTQADFPGVVSATTGNDDKLKVIAWKFNSQAHTFSRKGDASAGSIQGDLRIVRVPRGGRDIVVTAFRDESGSLKLIAWRISADGQVVRKGSATAGAASLVDLTPARRGHVVVSVRDSDSNLRMIGFHVDGDGKIARVGTDRAGQIDRVAASYIERDGNEFLLTAVRDNDDKLRLISWEANLQ